MEWVRWIVMKTPVTGSKDPVATLIDALGLANHRRPEECYLPHRIYTLEAEVPTSAGRERRAWHCGLKVSLLHGLSGLSFPIRYSSAFGGA